jgi:cellulose synthase/poly-beta-1,6-N-acetylglucosamine synthase-like glycosyltransferase
MRDDYIMKQLMHFSVFSGVITYILLFFSLYFEVFLLITFWEKRKQIREEESWKLSDFPEVTVIVPCFNEERTIKSTMDSLLSLNYPKEKLHLIVVDDGSTDNTWQIISKYEKIPRMKIFHKENGGKFTALNLGLTHTTTPYVGCLDADSFVHPEALQNIMVYFRDSATMAVTPSLKIHNPNSVIRLMQNVEYNVGIFVRKISSFLNAIYVTPGPFSIFRTRVFAELGPYRHAHNTEDMEMALRLQSNHYKIANAHKAVVYTVGPKTLPKLYKQRVRWTHGFLKNIKDYRHLVLNTNYGNLGMFTLPLAFISFFGSVYLILFSYYGIISTIIREATRLRIVGLHFSAFHFNWFFVNTEVISMINLLLLSLTLIIIFTGKQLAGVRDRRYFIDLIYSFLIYSLIAPFWLIKAFYSALFSKSPTWR